MKNLAFHFEERKGYVTGVTVHKVRVLVEGAWQFNCCNKTTVS